MNEFKHNCLLNQKVGPMKHSNSPLHAMESSRPRTYGKETTKIEVESNPVYSVILRLRQEFF